VPTLEQVLEANPETVKVVFKQFPLKMHKFANKAALAAIAAQKQGKFWEYHDLLFENYKAINDSQIEQVATDLELDLEQFKSEMKSPENQAKIRKDLSDGQQAGVRGTPTIFVDGRKLKARGMKGFQSAIDKALKNQKKED
jgi:protein-disulfide isomerase